MCKLLPTIFIQEDGGRFNFKPLQHFARTMPAELLLAVNKIELNFAFAKKFLGSFVLWVSGTITSTKNMSTFKKYKILKQKWRHLPFSSLWILSSKPASDSSFGKSRAVLRTVGACSWPGWWPLLRWTSPGTRKWSNWFWSSSNLASHSFRCRLHQRIN